MTKRVLALLSMALFLAVAASAATTITAGCGSAGATAIAQPGPPVPPFTPAVSGTAPCAAFPIPAGQTLSDVQVVFKNDWQLGASGTDTIAFNYTITGFNIPSMSSTVTGTGIGGSTVPVGTNQGTCSVTGDVVTCDDPLAVPIVGPGTFNAITITINGVWAAGGLDFSGSVGTTISALYTYAPSPSPPPPVCPPFLGRWIYDMDGTLQGGVPYTAAGQFTALAPPPVGRLTITQTASVGSREEVDVGTYQINSDCTGGTLTFNLSQHPLQFDFWFDEDFTEIRFVATTFGVAIKGTAERF